MPRCPAYLIFSIQYGFSKVNSYGKLRIISKERTEGGLNKRATFGAPLFSTLLVFPN